MADGLEPFISGSELHRYIVDLKAHRRREKEQRRKAYVNVVFWCLNEDDLKISSVLYVYIQVTSCHVLSKLLVYLVVLDLILCYLLLESIVKYIQSHNYFCLVTLVLSHISCIPIFTVCAILTIACKNNQDNGWFTMDTNWIGTHRFLTRKSVTSWPTINNNDHVGFVFSTMKVFPGPDSLLERYYSYDSAVI